MKTKEHSITRQVSETAVEMLKGGLVSGTTAQALNISQNTLQSVTANWKPRKMSFLKTATGSPAFSLPQSVLGTQKEGGLVS